MPKLKITEELKDRLKDNSKTLIPTRSTVLTEIQCSQIIELLKKQYDLEYDIDAYAIIAIMCQQGGSARSCSENFEIRYLNHTIKLATIRNVFKEAISDRYGLRKFARTHAKLFHDICLNSKMIPGNLSNKIVNNLENVKITTAEKVWLSDFQIDNEEAPERLRGYIRNYFKERKQATNKKKKGNKTNS